MELKVKFKRTHPDAVIPFKTYDSDYCYDVTAVSCKEIAPRVYKYGLGFALQVDRKDKSIKIPDGKRLAFDIRPRSSVWKTGLMLSNAQSTIDDDYTGEISMVFYHVLPELPIYKVGDRIGQLKIGFTLPLEFVEVEELDNTERGNGAYGSTGK